MSFAFRVTKERWTFDQDDPDNDLREILEIDMQDGDISPVTFPAYKQTDVGMRDEDQKSAGDYHKQAREAAQTAEDQEVQGDDRDDEAQQALTFARARSDSAALAAGINTRERKEQ